MLKIRKIQEEKIPNIEQKEEKAAGTAGCSWRKVGTTKKTGGKLITLKTNKGQNKGNTITNLEDFENDLIPGG